MTQEAYLITTIQDLARIADVSTATVSRVINGDPRVSGKTRSKVQTVIRETGYTPNELARALHCRSFCVIGVLIPTLKNIFYSQLAQTIEQEAYRLGYKVVLCSADYSRKKEKQHLHMLSAIRASGVIFIPSGNTEKEELEHLGIPAVVLDRKVEHYTPLSFLMSDHEKGGYLACRHLIECGCRKPVCMHADLKIESARLRYSGYRKCCAEHHIPFKAIRSGYLMEDGIKAARTLLSCYPDTDGIAAANDMMAFGVYRELHRHRIEVPGQIQLVGYDNLPFCELMTPSLSTISQPVEKMGVEAVRRITANSKKEKIPLCTTFDVELIKRETTLWKK